MIPTELRGPDVNLSVVNNWVAVVNESESSELPSWIGGVDTARKNGAKPPLMAADRVVDLATADSLELPPRLRR